MVKDLRHTKEKGDIQENLAGIIKNVTEGKYLVSREEPEGHVRLDDFDDGRKQQKPDLFIHYRESLDLTGITPKDFREKIIKLDEEPIEVYIRSEEDILFKVPKGDNLGLKIAEAYEKKFGKEVITIESLPDEWDLLSG